MLSFHNKIINGDSLNELKKIPDKSFDLVFADPPYNMQIGETLRRPDASKVKGVDDKWDQFESFKHYDNFCKSWLIECKRILKDNGSIWVIGSYHNIFRLGYHLQNLNYWLLNDVIWRKNNPMPNFRGTRFTNAHETLIWASKNKKSKYTFNYQTMKSLNNNKQMRSDWLINICSGKERLKDGENKKIHNTQKPEKLLHNIIMSSTKSGDIILDPFFGTGTTGAVCKKLGRKFIGIEKNSVYIKEAKKRIQKIKSVNIPTIKIEDSIRSNKVNFSKLLEKGLIKAGTKLFNNNKTICATVLSNGKIKLKENIGSIHQIGALVQKKSSCNGWNFWHTAHQNKLISINIHRSNYFRE